MNMETCDKHDDVIVVYDSWGNQRRSCPFCAANTEVEDLQQQVEDVEDERDGLKDDIADLRNQIFESEMGDDL